MAFQQMIIIYVILLHMVYEKNDIELIRYLISLDKIDANIKDIFIILFL